MIRLGPYELVREIAVGGMAEVHLARITGIAGFEKYFALKTIHPQFAEDDKFVAYLVNEAKIAVQLVHPNIAQTFDLGRVGDIYYMSMEFIDGIDLSRMIVAARGLATRLPMDACAFIVRDVAAALDHAHSRTDTSGRPLGVVHRDVSPQNVMITWEGVVKLVDFGIARAAGTVRHTQVGAITGKYQYMSPEQAWGEELDGRCDIFSTGLVLYELLTGRPAYVDADMFNLVAKARAGDIPPPSSLRPEIPAQLERIVMRALTVDRAQRYQQAGELMQDLRDFLRAHAPHFDTKALAALIESLFGRAAPPAPGFAADLDDISIRRLDNTELAHFGDELFDQNSVIARPGDHDFDLGDSSFDDTIMERSVIVVLDKPPEEPRAVTKLGLGPIAPTPTPTPAPTPPPAPTPTPTKAGFEKYTIHEQLGWSVLATVHRATLAGTPAPRDVALKRLAPQLADDAAFGERFFHEMALVSRVAHPNLVEIAEYGRIERTYFVASGLARGISLRKLLARARPAPIGVALGVIAQLLDGLAAAHRCAAHGSVTPGNVLVEPDGVVKITDLGTARALWGAAPHAIAKLGYMAPEVATNGIIGERADVFAVGVIAWELVVGRRLFDGRTPRDILQQLRTLNIDPPSRHNAQCPPPLDRLVLAALMRHDERTPSAAQMRAALLRFADEAERDRKHIVAWAYGPGSPRAELSSPDIDLNFTLAVDEPPAQEPAPPAAAAPRSANDGLAEESKIIMIDRGDDDP